MKTLSSIQKVLMGIPWDLKKLFAGCCMSQGILGGQKRMNTQQMTEFGASINFYAVFLIQITQSRKLE